MDNKTYSDWGQRQAPEARVVLSIALEAAYGISPTRPIDTPASWDRLNLLLAYHELLPFAYSSLKLQEDVPAAEKEFLKSRYLAGVFNSTRLWQDYLGIQAVFEREGLAAIPLKGIAFIAEGLYGENAHLRAMHDIDLLVKRQDLPRAERLMQEIGFSKDLEGLKEEYWERRNYHKVFVKEEQKGLKETVEIHWALDYDRGIAVLPELWGRLRTSGQEGGRIRLLSPEDTLFCLALHQRRFGKMLCLKDVCDVARLLHRYSVSLDWGYIRKESGRARLKTTLSFILMQVQEIFGSRMSEKARAALGMPERKASSIRRFILENTFSVTSAPADKYIRRLYLKNHFLLYDGAWEPVRYILFIPPEQFARYLGLAPYARITRLLYALRVFYFAVLLLFWSLAAAARKLSRMLQGPGREQYG